MGATAEADIDVLIVGGGLSGLVTASRILKKERTLKVVLLEAENVGGQINTDASGELGARWVSTEQIHVHQLCQEYKIKLVKRQNSECDMKKGMKDYMSLIEESNNPFFTNLEIKRFLNEIDVICEDMIVDPAYQYKTMDQFLISKLLFEQSRDFMRLMVRASSGVDAKEITLFEYLGICRAALGVTNIVNLTIGKNVEYPERGWKTLIDRIEAKVGREAMISKNKKVLRVLQPTDNVITVETSTERFHTRVLILALPWNEIMKIDFSPQIPRELRIMEPRVRSMMTSFIIEYSRSHWRANNFSGTVVSHSPQLVCYETKENILSGILYHSLSASHDSEIKSVCLSRLAEIFGSAMLTPIQWKALTTEQSLYLNVPPTSAWNRVIWGSTNTGTLFRGYLNGAVQGGLRSALLALLELRPQSVQWQDLNEIHWESFIKKRTGFFERALSSINVYNTLFNGSLASICFLGYYIINKK